MNQHNVRVIEASSIKEAINNMKLKVQIPLSKAHTINADGFNIRVSASTGQLTVTIQLKADTILSKGVTSLQIKITQEGNSLPKKAFYFNTKGRALVKNPPLGTFHLTVA